MRIKQLVQNNKLIVTKPIATELLTDSCKIKIKNSCMQTGNTANGYDFCLWNMSKKSSGVCAYLPKLKNAFLIVVFAI